jgi:hypothetical protein
MRTNKRTKTSSGPGRHHGMIPPIQKLQAAIGSGTCGLALFFAAIGPVSALDASPSYPSMAPIAQYRMASPSDEIALARSAAPASISNDAEVMVLGDHGYETTVKGKNGFVCIVERSWANNFNNAEFWNFKNRSPLCFNPDAARTVLPGYLERTRWVLTGVSKDEMLNRTKASVKATKVTPQGFSYMMSKQSYLSDQDNYGGHWHPHVMFFGFRTTAAAWGADVAGSPIYTPGYEGEDQITLFFIPVAKWSDGTPDQH